MKRVKTIFLYGIIILIAIMFFGCKPDRADKPEPKEPGLKKQIEAVIPDVLLNRAKSMGMLIHEGANPPKVEGRYLVDNLSLIKSSLKDFSPTGMQLEEEVLTLTAQNAQNHTVQLKREKSNSEVTEQLMVISGADDCFTLYAQFRITLSDKSTHQAAALYSGRIGELGIQDFYYAFFLMDNAQGAIFQEKDGVAAHFDGQLEAKRLGTIVLPDGCKLDTDKYQMVGGMGTSPISSDGSFSLPMDTNLQQAIYMADKNKKVRMLAYVNAGTESFKLDAESSAMGLFMMMSGARSELNKEQWVKLEQQLRNMPEFKNVVKEVEQLIKSDKDLLSAENVQLMKLYGKLFDALAKPKSSMAGASLVPSPLRTALPSDLYGAMRGTKDESHKPLVVSYENDYLVINNNGFAPAYLITIEEEDEKGNRKEVLKEALSASRTTNLSIGAIFTWTWGVNQPPAESVKLKIKPNTNYYISANSGISEMNRCSVLNALNLVGYVVDFVGLPVGKKCVQALAEQSYSTLKTTYDAFHASGPRDAAGLFVDRTLALVANGTVVECITGKELSELSSKAAKFLIKSLDVLGKGDAAASLTGHVIGLCKCDMQIDLCCSTDGKALNSCGSPYVYLTTPLSAGSKVEFTCRLMDAKKPGWIDLNGNEKKDADEEIKDGVNRITLRRADMKLFGDFLTLDFEKFELSLLRLNPNSVVDGVFPGKIKEFDAAGNRRLGYFSNIKGLTKIDVRDCRGLKEMTCKGKIPELDLTGCRSLTRLTCDGNETAKLVIKDLEALREVNCSFNRLTGVVLGNNKSLVKLNCTMNQLKEKAITDIVKGLPLRKQEDKALALFDKNPARPSGDAIAMAEKKNWELTPGKQKPNLPTEPGITLVYNQSHVSIRAKPTHPDKPGWVDANNNGIKDPNEIFDKNNVNKINALNFDIIDGKTPEGFSVKLYGEFEFVDASNPYLLSVSIDKEFKAQRFDIIASRALVKVNAQRCMQIEKWEITQNSKLTELDLTGCGMTQFYAFTNSKMSKLILKDCIKLNYARVESCAIKTIDVTGCGNLWQLRLRKNQISRMDVSSCSSLSELLLSDNAFDKKGLTELFDSLPDHTQHDGSGFCYVRDCPGSKDVTEDEEEALWKSKRWRIFYK